jgi:hypothetical protein
MTLYSIELHDRRCVNRLDVCEKIEIDFYTLEDATFDPNNGA